MEVGTALAILGSVTASKELLLRVLGPTADYFGEQLVDLVEKLNPRRRETLAKILARARTINEGQGDDVEGEVPPRVFRNIIDEGTFVDDDLAAEYLGGLLASSKVPSGRDNRGVALTALVNRLSLYSLRTHYILYAAAREVLRGKDEAPLNFTEDAKKRIRIYTPYSVYYEAMAFTLKETPDVAINHALFALQRERLIHDNCSWGDVTHIVHMVPDATDGGIIFTPSLPGIEFFMWAHGFASKPWTAFLDTRTSFVMKRDFIVKRGSRLLPPRSHVPRTLSLPS